MSYNGQNYPVTIIQGYTFKPSKCGISFRSFEIPATVTAVGIECFKGQDYLESVDIRGPLQTISSSVFEDCTSLKYIDLPETVETIGDKSFKNTAIKSITIPENVNFLGMYASPFEGCNLVSLRYDAIELTKGSMVLSHFGDMSSLKRVVFGPKVKVVPNTSFRRTSITDVVLPESVEKIGWQTFWSAQNWRRSNLVLICKKLEMVLLGIVVPLP
ncbi:MAG: leucine-rich repeat domain-containing protein [Candidatus Amulumruptor sp.]